MSLIAEHRRLITEGLEPDLPVVPLRSQDGMIQYIGLWSMWWGSDPNSPDGMKVVLLTSPDDNKGSATTTGPPATGAPAPAAAAAAAAPRTMASVPWEVLQLQSLSPTDDAWDLATRKLATSIEEYARETRTDLRCPGRLVYDPSQDVHNSRTLRNPSIMEAYHVRRIDTTEEPPAISPANVNSRSRVPYKVYRGAIEKLELQDVLVFVERVASKRKSVVPTDSGLALNSSLLAAVGEWHTWIVLTPVADRTGPPPPQ